MVVADKTAVLVIVDCEPEASVKVAKTIEVAVEGVCVNAGLTDIKVPLAIVGGVRVVDAEVVLVTLVSEALVTTEVTTPVDVVELPVLVVVLTVVVLELSLDVHSRDPTCTVLVDRRLGLELVKGAGPVLLLKVKGVQVRLVRSTLPSAPIK